MKIYNNYLRKSYFLQSKIDFVEIEFGVRLVSMVIVIFFYFLIINKLEIMG